jgi:hypothetical protein
MRRLILPLAMLLALAGCGSKPPVETAAPEVGPKVVPAQRAHLPDFARVPYAPFSRQEAVAIALREWRAFGQKVHDDPPHPDDPLPENEMESRQPGMWERVGEYWFLGQNADREEAAWTGKHGAGGDEFSARAADNYAWSAAFISYVMRTAGAGDAFPYSGSHYVYINAAAREALGRETGWAVTAHRPKDYAPQLGDLICTGRDRAAHMRFDRLPARPFPAHCDIVVAIAPGELSVLGGNVEAAVTMKHIPVAADGKLIGPDGRILDTRYDWFVVLQVAYTK